MSSEEAPLCRFASAPEIEGQRGHQQSEMAALRGGTASIGPYTVP
jgi:hypothetical protein